MADGHISARVDDGGVHMHRDTNRTEAAELGTGAGLLGPEEAGNVSRPRSHHDRGPAAASGTGGQTPESRGGNTQTGEGGGGWAAKTSGLGSSSRQGGTNFELGGRPVSESLLQHYEVGETLGRGSFAVVKEGRHKKTGQRVAIKMIDRNNKAFDLAALNKEVAVMQRIEHRNCIRLHEVLEEKHTICLVLDLVTGGELFDRIIARGSYTEKDAAEVTRDVLQAVAYLHAQGIVHRDLKPENLLYMSNDTSTREFKQIKVADFGLARLRRSDDVMRTICGTPGYVAPEVLDPKLAGSQGYNSAIDIWSIGVVLYIMLCGFPPFFSENTVTLFRQIRRGSYSFPSPYWDNISNAAKDLVRKMLVVEPSKRLTAQQCLEHHWIVDASLQEARFLGSQHKAFLLIRRLPLFEQVDPSCLAEVTALLKRVVAQPGSFVIQSGEEGKCMYFVGSTPQQTIGSGVHLGEDLARGIQRSKCLSVIVDGHEVTRLGTGDYFGEVALVSRADHKRTADVIALSACELFELSREDMMAVIQKFPILEARLTCMAAARLKRAQSSNHGPSGPSSGSANSLLSSEHSGASGGVLSAMGNSTDTFAGLEAQQSSLGLSRKSSEEPSSHVQPTRMRPHASQQIGGSLVTPLGQVCETIPQQHQIMQAHVHQHLQHQHVQPHQVPQLSPLMQTSQHTPSASGKAPGPGNFISNPHDCSSSSYGLRLASRSGGTNGAPVGGIFENGIFDPQRVIRYQHIFNRMPSRKYLEMPEAIPRVEPLMRMSSQSTFSRLKRVEAEYSGYGQVGVLSDEVNAALRDQCFSRSTQAWAVGPVVSFPMLPNGGMSAGVNPNAAGGLYVPGVVGMGPLVVPTSMPGHGEIRAQGFYGASGPGWPLTAQQAESTERGIPGACPGAVAVGPTCLGPVLHQDTVNGADSSHSGSRDDRGAAAQYDANNRRRRAESGASDFPPRKRRATLRGGGGGEVQAK